MATRLYPVIPGSAADTTPAITPTPSTSWEKTTGFARIRALTTAPSGTGTGTIDSTGNGANPNDILHFQCIAGPFTATTLTGNFKSVWRTREFNAATNARAQANVRAFDTSGVELAVLVAHDTSALSNEFINGTLETRRFPLNYTGSGVAVSQAIAVPFYIVAEFGARVHSTDTTNNVRLTHADTSVGAADGSETEGTTTTPAFAWFEFSQTLNPYVEAPAVVAAATGAALTASTTIAPTVSTATAVGAANDATISLATPPRSITINGTDYIGDTLYSNFSLTECANRGEVGTGGFDLIDGVSAFDIPALKAVLFEEPAAGSSDKRVYTGFTHERSTQALQDQALTAKVWGVETTDLNILASDYVLTDAEGADRPAETDYVRVAWLLTSALNSVGLVGVGIVPNTNTVTMEATDYRGRKPADLLAECSEASGKLWFIYDYGAGRKMYYDLATGTSLSSSVFLSDAAGDPNGTTVFAVQDVSVKKSPDRIYSKVHLTYNEGTVTVSDAGVASTYRQREAAVLDSSITDSTLATTKAQQLLDGAASEITEVEGLSYTCAAAYVNAIRQGQRVQIKLTRHGIAAYTYYRVIRRTVQPIEGQTHYSVSLGLASDVLASANGARGGYEIWPHSSNANDDGATVIVDRSGINVIDGAITVVNSGATVIIDGESDIFKIAAEGTQNVTATAGTINTTTTTLSGLGALAASPAHVIYTASSADPTFAQTLAFETGVSVDRYVASASAGSPTTRIVAGQYTAKGWVNLNGSDQAVVTLHIANATGSDVTRYQKYFVLVETVF